MPNNSNIRSSRLILASSSAAAALALVAYLIYRKRPTTSFYGSILTYFNSPPPPPPPSKSNPEPATTKRTSASSDEFLKRMKPFEKPPLGIERPPHRPSKTSSRIRTIETAPTSNETDDELTRLVDKFLSMSKRWPNSEPDSEFTQIVNLLLDQFGSIDSSRSREISSQLASMSTSASFKPVLTLHKLICLLCAHFSPKNVNLFSGYTFNNTLGEASTDVLVDLMTTLRSLSESASFLTELYGNEQLGQLVLRVLYAYIYELGKNGDNVRRARKLAAIKSMSLDVLSRVLDGFKNNLATNQHGAEVFVVHLSRLEAIQLPMVDKRIAAAATSRLEMLESYVRFVNSYLGLVAQLKLVPQTISSGCLSMFGYLMSRKFYVGLNEYFKREDTKHINESIESVFRSWNLVSELAGVDLDDPNKALSSSTSEYERVSIGSDT